MRTKRERAVTWWNPAVQMRPLIDSSSFTPVLTLHRRTCLHSASSVLTVRISFCVQKALIYQLNFTVFMFVTWISRYIQRSILSADMGAHLYFIVHKMYQQYTRFLNVGSLFESFALFRWTNLITSCDSKSPYQIKTKMIPIIHRIKHCKIIPTAKTSKSCQLDRH
jgi:hypothetical protein